MADLIVRIEPEQRAESLRPGLEARLLDPLWLLGRQWIFGEFDGEDAGTPVAVDLALGHYPLARLRTGAGEGALERAAPLEAAIEPLAPAGRWPLRLRVDTGTLLANLLADAGLAKLVGTLAGEYRIEAPGDADEPAQRLAGLVGGRVPDGFAVYDALATGGLPAVFGGPDVASVLKAWLGMTSNLAPVSDGAWRAERLEYAAELTCDGLADPLRVEEYWGDGLDWTSVTLDRPPLQPPPKRIDLRRTPSALRFRGMPLPRYWECEDAAIDLGTVDAPAAELGRTAMLQFAMLYGNDIFLVPVSVPRGSLAGILDLQVHDTFADLTGPLPLSSATRTGTALGCGFGLWSVECGGAPLPWSFFPPACAAPLHGAPIQDALLARDEMANRVWAIVRAQLDEDGRSRPPRGVPSDTDAAADSDTDYRYLIATIAPPGWYAMVLETGGTGRWLARAGGAGDESLSLLLPPGVRVHEEEVGREGVALIMENVCTRGSDGSYHAWTRVRRMVGRGGAASGLRYDLALPTTETP